MLSESTYEKVRLDNVDIESYQSTEFRRMKAHGPSRRVCAGAHQVDALAIREHASPE